MADIVDISTRTAYIRREPPTGGGTGDGVLEERVTRLEGQFEKLETKVDGLLIDMAVLKERVSHLPGKGFIVSATATTLGLLGALILLQDKIAAWLTP